jgi:general nucleoside transport system permease protein
MARRYSYRIEKREDIGIFLNVLSIVVAMVVSLIIASGIIIFAGETPKNVFMAILKGAFGSQRAIMDTLIKSTPILLTGLATVVPFRAKIWNIGQEGQLYAGAMGLTFVILYFPQMPTAIYILVLLLASVIGGALWAYIPGILKARYNVNEIIVTVMLNYVILYLCTFLLNGPWQEPSSYYYNTIRFPKSSDMPLLFGTHLHLGFLIALLLSFVIYFLLWKTKLGFEIRAMGENPTASRYKGINTRRLTIIVMLISGALCGLAGGIELLGIHHKLIYGFSSGAGFTGILIALLGRLHPFGVVLAAIFFGALRNGSVAMQIYSNVSSELVTLMMGMIIIVLLFSEAVFKYRIRRVENVD